MDDEPKKEYLDEVETRFSDFFSESGGRRPLSNEDIAVSAEIKKENEKNNVRKTYLFQSVKYLKESFQNGDFSEKNTLADVWDHVLEKYQNYFNTTKYHGQYAHEMKILFQVQSAVSELIGDGLSKNMTFAEVLNELDRRYESIRDIKI